MRLRLISLVALLAVAVPAVALGSPSARGAHAKQFEFEAYMAGKNEIPKGAPNGKAKYMPNRLVHIQFTAVRPTRSTKGIAGVTGKSASNEMLPLTWTWGPACNFLVSAG